MLDMGFGPTINNIISNSEMPPKGSRTTLMFSATFPKEIQQMASAFLNDYLFLTVGRVGGTCADVQQIILQVAGSEKRSTLEKILQESGKKRFLSLVLKSYFCKQVSLRATKVASKLQKKRCSTFQTFEIN